MDNKKLKRCQFLIEIKNITSAKIEWKPILFLIRIFPKKPFSLLSPLPLTCCSSSVYNLPPEPAWTDQPFLPAAKNHFFHFLSLTPVQVQSPTQKHSLLSSKPLAVWHPQSFPTESVSGTEIPGIVKKLFFAYSPNTRNVS